MNVRKLLLENARHFLPTAFEEMRFDFHASLLSFAFIDGRYQQTPRTCQVFKNIIGDKEIKGFNNELDVLKQERITFSELMRSRRENPFIIWHQEVENKRFPIVYELIRALEVLPFSTVDMERAFSTINDVKTSNRSNLSVSRQESYLLLKQKFEDKDFLLSPEILESYTLLMQKKGSKERSEDPAQSFGQVMALTEITENIKCT